MKLIVFSLILFTLSFIFLAGCLQTNPPVNETNTTQEYRIFGDPSVFFASLSKSRNFSVVMDFTGEGPAEKNSTIILCGVGIISSWTDIGKNISYLMIYTLEDPDKCTRSLPGMNETYNTTIEECRNLYTVAPYSYVSYGPPETYYTNSSWKIVIDKDYIQTSECGFKPNE